MKKRVLMLSFLLFGGGMQTSADAGTNAASLQQWLLGDETALSDSQTYDMNGDGRLNAMDLTLLKRSQLQKPLPLRTVQVTDTDSLKAALSDAKAGDEILLASGTYVYHGSTPKGRMFTGTAEGTEQAPIVLRSEDAAQPAILSGINIEGSYVLTITGDWWELRDLHITNAAKGIILDNANHVKVIGCEVYQIGQEGIHFRDDSSYGLAEDCYIHDTGLYTPKFGEGIYVGSSKSTTGYGYNCDYNTIRRCRIGPDVAAEHVDIKEYTTGTIVEYCSFDGTGMTGENYADSFVDVKGNDTIVRYNTGWRNGCEQINRAFEMNRMLEGWGQNGYFYGNKVYMDTATNGLGKKMVFLNAWDCTATVWDNQMAYEDGELIPIDELRDDPWKYYNCNCFTYGDASMAALLP